jgi:hypothetical protein
MNASDRREWRRKVVATIIGLKEAGAFEGLSREERFGRVLTTVIVTADIEANPKFDWQGLLAFLEAIIPILLLIFGL